MLNVVMNIKVSESMEATDYRIFTAAVSRAGA